MFCKYFEICLVRRINISQISSDNMFSSQTENAKRALQCTQMNTAFLLGLRVVEIHQSPENLLPSFILLFCHHHHKTIKSQLSSLGKSKVPHFIITVRKRSLGQGDCSNSGTVHEFARSALKLVLLDSHKTYHF